MTLIYLGDRIIKLDEQLIKLEQAYELMAAQFKVKRDEIPPSPDIDSFWVEVTCFMDPMEESGYRSLKQMILDEQEGSIEILQNDPVAWARVEPFLNRRPIGNPTTGLAGWNMDQGRLKQWLDEQARSKPDMRAALELQWQNALHNTTSGGQLPISVINGSLVLALMVEQLT